MIGTSLSLLFVVLAGPAFAEPGAANDLRDAVGLRSPSAIGAIRPPAPRLRDFPTPIDAQHAQWAGALPSTCESLGSMTAPGKAPSGKPRLSREELEVFARLAQFVCQATAGQNPDPETPSVRVAVPNGVVASAETRQIFAYQPQSWLVVHKLAVTGKGRRELEFWPAELRDLPGNSKHGAYFTISTMVPGRAGRAVSFMVSSDGSLEPYAWAVTEEGGSHVAVRRPDVQRWLKDELRFWAKSATKLQD